MWKRIWQLAIVALALFSFASSRCHAQYEFSLYPDSLVIHPGGFYEWVYGWLVNTGTDPLDIRFTAFNDGLVAVGVTVDTTPFYDWVFTLDDLTLRLEPWVHHWIPLFNVYVDPDAPAALYEPIAILEFDEIGGASVELGASWELHVVPEPATVVTMGGGLAMLLFRRWRKRQ
ncbi:MAG: PEP-CTERM sorting domain-containing protein [Firmicutes bacterium]|nr:PEP-CTERM sorting domain-containing protein [Bacillota bacterium]